MLIHEINWWCIVVVGGEAGMPKVRSMGSLIMMFLRKGKEWEES